MSSIMEWFATKIRRIVRQSVDWHQMTRFHGTPSWTLYLIVAVGFIALGCLILFEPWMNRDALHLYVPR